MARWTQIDVHFDLVEEASETTVVTGAISTPSGDLRVMANVERCGERGLLLTGLHVEGPAANRIGIAGLRAILVAIMERMDYDEIVVQGAARTSGASPGRRPGKLRFTRHRRDPPG